ncbi:MAG: EamA family transporter [Bdellovibrionales bacterium]|nr:EamA family transporter [Bdellovibrionales bacterium]
MNPGIPIAFLAAVFSFSKDIVSKHLSFKVSSLVSTLASFAYSLPFYILALIVSWSFGQESFLLSKSFFIFVLLRSLTDVFAENFKMRSLEKGDISLVSPFISLSPVFLIFLSPLLTGESISLIGTIGIILTVVGCLVVFGKFSLDKLGKSFHVVLTSLASAFFFALNGCFDWLAVHEATPIMSGFAMSLCSALLILPFIRSEPKWKGQLIANKKAFLLRGFFETAFMTAKLAALQFISAHYVSALVKTAILGSIIAGGVVFKEKDISRKLIGAALIIVGAAIIIFEL